MNEIDLDGLNKVDRVCQLMNQLIDNTNGDDESTRIEIDRYLKENKETKGFDRTVINNDKDEFVRQVERDAAERANRRALARKTADEIKSKANEYYKANDFDKSIVFYSKAIEKCRDFEILYTNRAQAYLKTDRVSESLADCETALRLNPDNHKALLHKGRSLARLNRFDEAIDCYKEVVRLSPALNKYVSEFIEDAESLKRCTALTRDSATVFDQSIDHCGDKSTEGDLFLNEITDKLVSKNEDNLKFYVGGLEMLISILDNDCKAIECLRNDLRVSKRLFDSKCEIQKRLKNIFLKKNQKITEIEWILLSLWMRLLKKIAMNDESSTIALFHDHSISACLNSCTKSTDSIPFSVLSAVVSLLFYMSKIETGLQQIVDKFSVHNILSITLAAMKLDQKNELVTVGMAFFSNLVKSERFKIALGKDEELVKSVIDCLYEIFSANVVRNIEELPNVISIIEMLSDNSKIRLRLIKHDKFLEECMKTIEARLAIHDEEKHSSVLLQLFTLIHNLLVTSKNLPTGDKVKLLYYRIVTSSTQLLSCNPTADIRSVLIQVLSQMLAVLPEDKLKTWCECDPPNSTVKSDGVSMCRSLSRQSSLTDIGYLDKVCKPLKLCVTILDAPNHPLLPYSIKILTLASKVNEAVRFLCCDVRERVLKLRSLLYDEKEKTHPFDEYLSGNICLLLSHCVSETPLAEHLLNTGIIKDLLRICADANKTDCKRNAAILVGNLAQSNHVHREELSRLNGFSIISKFNNWSR